METPAVLKDLADILQRRKEASERPYTLLLTSALSLSPTMLSTLCGTENWDQFRRFIQQKSRNDRRLALHPLLHSTHYRSAYTAMTHLIATGYFSTILTTNIDSALEDALNATGGNTLAPQILVLQRDPEEHIKQTLHDLSLTLKIVKLHGDLRGGIVPDHFPDFSEFSSGLRKSLRNYLNQDLIIVGSLEHDHDVRRMLSWESEGSLYYVTGRELSEEETIYRLIRERGGDPSQRLFTGPLGDANRFFTTLEHLLLPAALPLTASAAQPEKSYSPSIFSTVHTRSQRMPAMQDSADVLLVTVTKTETLAVLNALKALDGRTYELCSIGDKTYYALGVINNARIFLVQSEMGISGTDGSLLTISEGLSKLAPHAVIMVGIAFGFDSQKQRIGEVLVSKQLLGYELQRVGAAAEGTPSFIPRGDRVAASSRLVDRFRIGEISWHQQGQKQTRISFGLIVSGEKLVDNKDFRDHLRLFEPEALGGEMEGYGLYSVAQRHKVDWILVKAICDWADGNKAKNKTRNQNLAARNAAKFTLHVLQETQLY